MTKLRSVSLPMTRSVFSAGKPPVVEVAAQARKPTTSAGAASADSGRVSQVTPAVHYHCAAGRRRREVVCRRLLIADGRWSASNPTPPRIKSVMLASRQ